MGRHKKILTEEEILERKIKRQNYNRIYYQKWKASHPDYKKEHYTQNRDTYIANQKKFRQLNPDYDSEYRQTQRGRARHLLDAYIQSDDKYNRGECTLTTDWIVENIFTSKCHYCGESDWLKLGCDRINNDLPHTPENVVCSCGECNVKRGTMPFAEFVKEQKEMFYRE